MTHPSTEAIARIIDPDAYDALGGVLSTVWHENARARAVEVLTLIQPGEEFLEFKEALSDLRSLRSEHRALNGGGPGFNARYEACWVRIDELFANEDEAAYDRQQQDAHG